MVSMATPYTNYVCMHMKQKGDVDFCALKTVTPSRHEHALPYTPTFDRVYISKRPDHKKLKTIKTHFDRLKQFGVLFRRLTSLLHGFLWSCPQKTSVLWPKFPL